MMMNMNWNVAATVTCLAEVSDALFTCGEVITFSLNEEVEEELAK